MAIRSGQMKQCNWLCGLSSVPPGTSGAKPGHLGVPKTTFRIPGQSVPNRDCPGKTGTVGQLGQPANLAFNKIQRQYNRCCYLAAAVTASANVQLPAICTNCSLHRPLLDRTSMHSCYLTTGNYVLNSKPYSDTAYPQTKIPKIPNVTSYQG